MSEGGSGPAMAEGGPPAIQWTPTARKVFMEELQDEANKRCREYVEEYVRCVSEKGINAIAGCRGQTTAMNNCLRRELSSARAKEFEDVRVKEILADAELDRRKIEKAML